MPLLKLLPFLLLASICLVGCSPDPHPVNVRDGDSCAHCRMQISNPRLAAQIAAPGEEPLFYDDIGCLAKALAAGRSAAFAYVADHRSGVWVPAAAASYTRVPSLETPMGSHIIAHADETSRREDPAAAGGILLSAAEVFGGHAAGEHDGG